MTSLRYAVTLLSIVALASTIACGGSQVVETSFTVEGMTCESCSAAITAALEKVDGVSVASADHVAGTARAVFISPQVTPEQLVAEIEGLGYTVTGSATAPTEG